VYTKTRKNRAGWDISQNPGTYASEMYFYRFVRKVRDILILNLSRKNLVLILVLAVTWQIAIAKKFYLNYNVVYFSSWPEKDMDTNGE